MTRTFLCFRSFSFVVVRGSDGIFDLIFNPHRNPGTGTCSIVMYTGNGISAFSWNATKPYSDGWPEENSANGWHQGGPVSLTFNCPVGQNLKDYRHTSSLHFQRSFSPHEGSELAVTSIQSEIGTNGRHEVRQWSVD